MVACAAQLVRTLRAVLSARDWWHLPRFAFGSSRGGAMTLILALRFPFQVGIEPVAIHTALRSMLYEGQALCLGKAIGTESI